MNASLAASLVIVAFFVVVYYRASRYPAPLPPGPKGWPVIGNLLDMPRQKTWRTFSQWADQYGDICSVTVFGQPIIIINSLQAGVELIDRKSAIHSDRPVLPMGGELIGWRNTLPLIRYGSTFRKYRKYFHQMIGTPEAITKFEPFEEDSTVQLLQRLTEDPDGFVGHIRTYAGKVLLRVAYGYDSKGADDQFTHLLHHGMAQFAVMSAPGAFLVDLLPSLRFVPAWFPGGGFHHKARAWARDLAAMGGVPFKFAKEQFTANVAKDSFTARVLTSDLNPTDEHIIKWTASSISAGGFATTNASLKVFLLMMSLNPEVQKKAQAEIDAVVGKGKLPEFTDRTGLPYVNALCKEVFRIHTIVPTGLPHVSMEDDFHNGYFIPKGSLIITNLWHMSHSPTYVSEPDVFKPERFLGPKKEGEKDCYDINFGFGRRACPGRLLGENSMFITAAMILATCDIMKKVDGNGMVVEPVIDPMTGSISHPAPFECTIKPRSEEALALIVASAQATE